jgi:multisubunit Na+/H+ antiporter MnhG subunit
MSLIHNERIKLLANNVDRASTSCLTLGVIGPVAAVIYNIGGAGTSITAEALYLGSAAWLAAGVVLHVFARAILGRLK